MDFKSICVYNVDMPERKDQSKTQEINKFSEKELFQMIEAANLSFNPTLKTSEDGELLQSYIPENLLDAVREVGSDCIHYQNLLNKSKRQTKGIISTFVGVVGISVGLSAQIPALSIPGLMTFITGLSVSLANDPGIGNKDLENMKTKVENDLRALSLPEEYVNRHFNKIVRVLANTQRPIMETEKKSREEREKMENAIIREAEIEERRRRLGLNDTQETGESLEDLLKRKNS